MLPKLPPVASGRKVVRGTRPALASISENEDYSRGVKRNTTLKSSTAARTSTSLSFSDRFKTRKTKRNNNTFDFSQKTLSNMWWREADEKEKEKRADSYDDDDSGGGGGYHNQDFPMSEEDIIQLEDLIRITGPDVSYDANGKVINYTPAVDPIRHLTTAQNNIYEKAMNGVSFFFTGAAGTGKSYTLRHIIKSLREKYSEKENAVHVLAPTGIAACNIEGTTIHSFASLKPSDLPKVDMYVKHLKKTGGGEKRGKRGPGFYVMKKWTSARVIIIDEISMVSAKMLDFLDQAAKTIRKTSKPFGGIQLILCGDFCQLSPVNEAYAFTSHCWNNVMSDSIELVENFRQNRDLEYAKALNEIRFGVFSTEARDIIDTCRVPFKERDEKGNDGIDDDKDEDNNEKEDIPQPKEPGNVNDGDEEDEDDDDDDIECTVLYPVNKKVDYENITKLKRLPGEFYTIEAEDKITKKKTRGRIIKKQTNDHITKKQTKEQVALNRTEAQINFIKKKLLHTLRPPKTVVLKIGAQVILTTNLDTSIGLANGARGVVKSFKRIGGDWIPVVKFCSGQKIPVLRYKFDIRSEDEIIAERTQVPLILGFACTIHKSQGMTLDKVRMSISTCWSQGQVYTALSRASSTRGLYIDDFDEFCIKADPQVIKLYKSIHHVKLEELRLQRQLKKKKEKSPW